MAVNRLDPAPLEELREKGDYDSLSDLVPENWHEGDGFDADVVRVRLLVAELAGRAGRLDRMEEALQPYLEDVNRIPFGLAPRVLLVCGFYRYRRGEPSEANCLAAQAKTVARALDDEMVIAEAIQLEGQALWSLEKWEEAAGKFEEALALFASQARAYRLGLANMCLGAVLNRMGRVEEARGVLERGLKPLLKSRDAYTIAVARVNVALPLNVIGEYETALKYLTFAHDTFEQIGHDQYSYLSLNNIASTLVYLRDYERAEAFVTRALEKGIASRSTQIASTYEVKARVHLARREWDKAERSLKSALEIAGQANSQSQMVEVKRTMGRLYLAQDREDDAASVLWEALDLAIDLRASLLEMELKALLSQAICMANPVEACKLLSGIEAELGDRPLPELRRETQAARRKINSLDYEHYFILTDAEIPALADAKLSLLKWLWARALYRARGNAREAAAILGVTPTYIRKLTKLIPRDLLRGRKRKTGD